MLCFSSLLLVEVDVSQERVIVVISGELDLTTRPALAERLSAILSSGPRRVVLDLSGTEFIDVGSARLIASLNRFLPDGGRLIIRRPSLLVRRVLHLTGLDAECEIQDELGSDHVRHHTGCAPRPDRAGPAAFR
jgi:anti-sigma B factor antagonist